MPAIGSQKVETELGPIHPKDCEACGNEQHSSSVAPPGLEHRVGIAFQGFVPQSRHCTPGYLPSPHPRLKSKKA